MRSDISVEQMMDASSRLNWEARPASTKRRSAPAWRPATLGLATLLLGCASKLQHGGTPIVLIVVDALRADHLSQYGYSRATSRAIDSFSEQATRFDRCYAPASWTTPSTASILTGLLPMRHGADSRGAALDRNALTLAEILEGAGWTTIGVSYNHNITRTTAFDQGFVTLLDVDGGSGDYPDIAEMRTAARKLLRTSPPPLFLYLQPMNVHGPYRTPDEHRSDLLGFPPGGEFKYSGSLMDSIMKDGRLERRGQVTEVHLKSHRDQYDTAVRYSMDQIAGILDDLREAGLYDDSLIVLTADHGEELFDHQGFGHGYTLYDELLRVPLWIKPPKQVSADVIEQPVSLTDLLPTILDVVGIDVPSDLDGRSFTDLLNHDPDATRRGRVIVSETRWPGRFDGSSVLEYPWKLIHVGSNYEGRSSKDLLFNLELDPMERNEVAAQHAEVVLRLARLLDETRRTAGPKLTSEDVSGKMNEERLKALGYGE